MQLFQVAWVAAVASGNGPVTKSSALEKNHAILREKDSGWCRYIQVWFADFEAKDQSSMAALSAWASGSCKIWYKKQIEHDKQQLSAISNFLNVSPKPWGRGNRSEPRRKITSTSTVKHCQTLSPVPSFHLSNSGFPRLRLRRLLPFQPSREALQQHFEPYLIGEPYQSCLTCGPWYDRIPIFPKIVRWPSLNDLNSCLPKCHPMFLVHIDIVHVSQWVVQCFHACHAWDIQVSYHSSTMNQTHWAPYSCRKALLASSQRHNATRVVDRRGRRGIGQSRSLDCFSLTTK